MSVTNPARKAELVTDTIACPSCGAQLPAAAAFCTSCGQRVAADPTVVGTPGLNDPTQVVPPEAPPHPNPPAPPMAPPPMVHEAPLAPPPAPSSGPWGPASTGAAPDGPPTTAPWDPPANPPPPSWQQPTPPMEPQAWAGPGGMAPASVYGTAPAPAGAPAATGRRPSIAGGLAAIVGAVLTIAGVFSGWVTLRPQGSSETVSMWSLASGDGFLKTNDPYVLVALAGCAGLVGLLLLVGVGRTVARILAIVLGLAIIGVVAADWMSISSFVEDNFPTTFQAQTAIGLYLAVAGGVITAIAGLLPAKKQ